MATAATTDQRNYALRRIIYNTMIAAKALDTVPRSGTDYSQKELAKASGMIMARNLHDFFFRKGNQFGSKTHVDDISSSDFLLAWSPSQTTKVSSTDYKRINKLVGHIVAEPPEPFSDTEIAAILGPLVGVAVEFVNHALSEAKASYTGKAPYYARRLNGTLKKLGIPRLQT